MERENAPDGKKRQLNVDKKDTKNMKSEKKRRKETSRDRLLKWNSFYTRQKFGIWIQCTQCNKWRKSLEYEEDHEVPNDWCCSMDISRVKGCYEPENVDYNNDDFSPVHFIPGSIVWAKMDGYPWWPAMIEIEPDVEEYYWIESNGKCFYNVTFLDDKVSRAWVSSTFVRPFVHNPHPLTHLISKHQKAKYEHLIKAAEQKANEAITMSIKERLERFSFAHRYKGKWSEPLEPDSYTEEDNVTEIHFKEGHIKPIKCFISDYDYRSKLNTKDAIQSDSKNSVEYGTKRAVVLLNKNEVTEYLKIPKQERENKRVNDILLNRPEKNLKNQAFDSGNNRNTKVNMSEETNVNIIIKGRDNGMKKDMAEKKISSSKFQMMNKKKGTKSTVNNSVISIIQKPREIIDSLTKDSNTLTQNSSSSKHPSTKEGKKHSTNSEKKLQVANADAQMPIKICQMQYKNYKDAKEKSNSFKLVTKEKSINKKGSSNSKHQSRNEENMKKIKKHSTNSEKKLQVVTAEKSNILKLVTKQKDTNKKERNLRYISYTASDKTGENLDDSVQIIGRYFDEDKQDGFSSNFSKSPSPSF